MKGTLVFLNLLIIFAIFVQSTNGYLPAGDNSWVYKAKECRKADREKSFKDPDKCGGYFFCTSSGVRRTFIMVPMTCSKNKTFDDKTKLCSKTQVCPEPIPELTLPSGWTCDENGLKYADPSNCRQYYTCDDCKSPENKGQKCYTSGKCSDTEYFDNCGMACVKSTVCPQERLELPKDEQWHCVEDGELRQNPRDCSKYYKCHQCHSDCRDWCYQMYQCSPKDFHFDETEGKCVKDGECKIKPTEPPTEPSTELPMPPPRVDDPMCDMQHYQSRWPDKENCQCYYECTRIFIPFMPYVYKNKQICCEGGSFDPVGMKCSEKTC